MRTLLKTGLAAGVMVLLALAVAASDFPNVKEGLWEMTVSTPGGMPGMSSDALANMPPEQRARMEEMMKQRGINMSGNTITAKSCVTKEKLAKGAAFSDSKSANCSHTVVKSTASHMEITFHCESKSGSTTEGTSKIDILGTDSVKGTTHVTTTSNGNSKTFDTTFTSKYLGADCGDIK